MDLEEALDHAKRIARDLMEQRAKLDRSLEDVQMEIDGLQRAVQRHSGRRNNDETATSIRGLARTDAIEEVLKRAGRPLGPTEITQALNTRGRADRYNAVSAAVAYLGRTGRVHSVGRAQWVHGPQPEHPRPLSGRGPDQALVPRADTHNVPIPNNATPDRRTDRR